LLAAALAGLTDGAQVLRATGSELQRDFAFGAIRQLFEPALAGATTSERARLLGGAAAPGASVLDPSDEAAGGVAEFAVLNGLYWLAASLAERPLVLAVDDLHWVDVPSLRALEFLALRLADLPVVLVATLRPTEPGAPAGDAVCDAFHESSAGNPLYLRELVLSTVSEGLALDGDAAAVHRATVPTLADRLARRVARLAPEAVDLATAMAVLGDGSALRLAAAMCDLDLDAAARLARQLTDIEVLASDDPFAFAHPVPRRSLYERLTSSERERRHADATRVLGEAGAPAEAIATHVSALPPAGSGAVVATLRDAARLASSRAAPAAAIPQLRRALDEGAEEPPAATRLHDLGRAEMSVRDPACLPPSGRHSRPRRTRGCARVSRST
jgi:hypothetical protein